MTLRITDEQLQKAFDLAFILHPSRKVALRVTMDACDFLTALQINQLRRGRSSKHYKSEIPDEMLIQFAVFLVSYVRELDQESSRPRMWPKYQPTRDDLLVRYVKHLIWKASSLRSKHLAVGLGTLLFSYKPSEIADLLCLNEEAGLRHIKMRLSRELMKRFRSSGIAHPQGKGIRTIAASDHDRTLVNETLRCLVPWNSNHITPIGPDSSLLETLSNEDLQIPDWDRKHALIDPECGGLERLINEHNVFVASWGTNRKGLPEPSRMLMVPDFDGTTPTPPMERFERQVLSDTEKMLLREREKPSGPWASLVEIGYLFLEHASEEVEGTANALTAVHTVKPFHHELISALDISQIDVRIDLENLFIGLVNRGWRSNLSELVSAIRVTKEKQCGGLVLVTGYVDCHDLNRHYSGQNTNWQGELALAGAESHYVINQHDKNAADMKIATDICPVVKPVGKGEVVEGYAVQYLGIADHSEKGEAIAMEGCATESPFSPESQRGAVFVAVGGTSGYVVSALVHLLRAASREVRSWGAASTPDRLLSQAGIWDMVYNQSEIRSASAGGLVNAANHGCDGTSFRSPIHNSEWKEKVMTHDEINSEMERTISQAVSGNAAALDHLLTNIWTRHLIDKISTWTAQRFKVERYDIYDELVDKLRMSIHKIKNPDDRPWTSCLKSWCYTVSKSYCLNRQRHARIVNRYQEWVTFENTQAARMSVKSRFVTFPLQSEEMPDKILLKKEEAQIWAERLKLLRLKVKSVLEACPPGDIQIVSLWAQGKTLSQIADATERPISTVQRRLKTVHREIIKRIDIKQLLEGDPSFYAGAYDLIRHSLQEIVLHGEQTPDKLGGTDLPFAPFPRSSLSAGTADQPWRRQLMTETRIVSCDTLRTSKLPLSGGQVSIPRGLLISGPSLVTNNTLARYS